MKSKLAGQSSSCNHPRLSSVDNDATDATILYPFLHMTMSSAVIAIYYILNLSQLCDIMVLKLAGQLAETDLVM